MKAQTIEIKSFEDIQALQEKYEIPFAANITQVIIELINTLARLDAPSVTITLIDEIMPNAYKYNTCIWARHFTGRVPYPSVRSYRVRGEKKVYIHAGMEGHQPNFYKQLKTMLTEADVASFPIDKVPKAYKQNPYILVHRLRTMGTETKATLTKEKLTITRK